MIKAKIYRTEEGCDINLFQYCGDKLKPSEEDWRQIARIEVDVIEDVNVCGCFHTGLCSNPKSEFVYCVYKPGDPAHCEYNRKEKD